MIARSNGAATAPPPGAPARSTLRMTTPAVAAVGSIGLTVADLERSVRFFTDVLGFVLHDLAEPRVPLGRLYALPAPATRVARLRLGGEEIELTEFRAPRGRPVPADSRSNDRWFQHIAIVVRDIYQAQQRLAAAGVTPISGAPQRIPEWNPAAAGVRAYYFRDPDGHPLELLEFPPGRGRAKWHAAPSGLFLGIDHTAIVVGNTAVSRRFYSDLLALDVVGGSENYGVEQELLSGVPGARVRITNLAAAHGPGIELLEYLAPTDGRALPAGSRPNDCYFWRTTLHVQDAAAAERAARHAGCTIISKGITRVPVRGGFAAGFLARDPDGHALQFVSATSDYERNLR